MQPLSLAIASQDSVLLGLFLGLDNRERYTLSLLLHRIHRQKHSQRSEGQLEQVLFSSRNTEVSMNLVNQLLDWFQLSRQLPCQYIRVYLKSVTWWLFV